MTGEGRTGILGGTFDPVHLGHLEVAEAARRALQLDRILVVPAQVPPHRETQPLANGYHRFAMVALAVPHCAGCLASDLELLSTGGPSYTSATLEQLHGQGLSPSQLFFIAGADAFAEIAMWNDYPAVLDRCHFVVVARPGFPLESLPQRLPELASRMVEAPREAGRVEGERNGKQANVMGAAKPAIFLVNGATPDISSSAIRARVAAGRSIAGLVPPEVERHIRRHGLYALRRGCSASPVGKLHEPTRR